MTSECREEVKSCEGSTDWRTWVIQCNYDDNDAGPKRPLKLQSRRYTATPSTLICCLLSRHVWTSYGPADVARGLGTQIIQTLWTNRIQRCCIYIYAGEERSGLSKLHSTSHCKADISYIHMPATLMTGLILEMHKSSRCIDNIRACKSIDCSWLDNNALWQVNAIYYWWMFLRSMGTALRAHSFIRQNGRQ